MEGTKFMIDIKMKEEKKRAVLVGINVDEDMDKFEASMRELKGLVKAADMVPTSTVTQNASAITQATLIGSGKVDEVKQRILYEDADVAIFNQTLTPMQIRNLSKLLDVEVIDRTALILEIFEKRARTKEARLQVESASLQYLLPRLAHMREGLSRQGGASGSKSSKGAGEKKIELDKRHIEHRLSEVRRELDALDKERATQRNKRLSSPLPRISLVGYTNAGKSTIMNSLISMYSEANNDSKKVLEENMLFATLDTTVRKIEADNHQKFLLSDTVGFIDDLPTTLVKAFRTTLEEIKYADLLIHVIDYSDDDNARHMEVTDRTLSEIGAGNIPKIYVFNKTDIEIEKGTSTLEIPYVRDNRIYMSAKDEKSIDELCSLIDKVILEGRQKTTLLIPYSDGNIVSYLNEKYIVDACEYLEDGSKLTVCLDKEDLSKFKKYTF